MSLLHCAPTLEVQRNQARQSEACCRGGGLRFPHSQGQLTVRALRQKFSWRLVDSQRRMVHAAKRKLMTLQAGGRGHADHDTELCGPAGRIALVAHRCSVLLAEHGPAPARFRAAARAWAELSGLAQC